MRYLSAAQILLIHSILIDEYGGSHGVRDMHALESLERLPAQTAFGKQLYKTIFLKAALYARNVITGHPFIDGNKRAGITAALVFLENNGYRITSREGEVGRYAIRIARTEPSLGKIAAWLKKHSRKV
ncbi:hypothetical protein A3A39_01760 [Candidatus Kaiserbacteria bacterium RIFCSPLOWO2_01_FULL_54_13]|uniref:Fido domain-containing protein n=1 Tax=Candidatus Kaiserbacteria bacterium RIFCSPLOWO2_01_FULL_54_13 TaxID=1798512 RepID=A0A1F6F1F9_9BACT|nr:MAG: hypothetical protein A3A39_01760 [Candidatus Kaiserbacteria bacterium RIFCSPLOWO2_01_FULL_54_13]